MQAEQESRTVARTWCPGWKVVLFLFKEVKSFAAKKL